MSDFQQTSPNSFVMGFTFGVLTGAVGYFLFSTDRGSRLRKQMLYEWKDAKVRLAEEGVIQNPDETFRQALQDGLHRFAQFTQELSSPSSRSQALNQVKKIRSPGRPRKASVQKFKGV